jgi:hypothetical protein
MKKRYFRSFNGFLMALMMLTSIQANAQPSTWAYFNEITIDNSGNSSNLSDYSVLVIVNTASLISAGKMNADGSDIRFTTDFTDNLSYWIDPGIQNEYGINTAATHIWVKVPAINATGTSTIKLKYGNPSADAESNISTTFLLGDDFNDNTLDASKWNTTIINSGQILEQNQRLEHNSPASNPESFAYLQSIQSFTEPVVLEMQFKKGGYVYRNAGFSETYPSTSNAANFNYQDYGLISANTTIDGTSNSISYSDQYWSTTYNPEYYLSIIRKPDGNFSYSLSVPSFEPGGPLTWNNDIAASMPLTTPLVVTANDYVWYAASNLQTRYEDNIRVRKYSSPEPTTTLSAEQPMATYCIPPTSVNGCGYMWITNLTTSGGISEINNNTDCSAISYTDFSSSYKASNKKGALTSLTFTSSGYALSYSVWIDYNNDNLFSQEEQVIMEANSSALLSLSNSFTIPDTVALGVHRMRVRGEYFASGTIADPCSQLQYGETEDYSFEVLPSIIPSTVNLTFNVDMTQPINSGFFIPGTDVLYVTGTFANANGTGWDMPGTGESLILTDGNSDNIFTGNVAVDTSYGELNYKYFKNASFDYGDNITGDRTIYIGKTDYVINPADIWYITSPVTGLPIDFETGPYTFMDFAGGITTVISNPQVTGINTSYTVAQQIRNYDQPYAGSKLPLTGYLDFTSDKIITMKVFSPKAGMPVVLKAENNDNTQSSGDIYAYTSKAWEWEILVFNFDGFASGVFNNLTFIFDMGSFGDGSSNSTFLFDDITLGGKELFYAGNGTLSNPYQISTPEQLNNVRKFLGPQYTDVYFSQITSIDLGVYPWNYGEGWEPIGNSSAQFYGNYSGNWTPINGLTINRPDSNYVGLFGRVREASLTYIDLANVSIIGNRHVGSIVGQMRDNSYATNCRATGNLSAQIFAGGIAASVYFGSTLEHCSSLVNVQMILGSNGNQQIGGLVGRLHDNSLIINSFAAGNVDGLENGAWIGGFVGFASNNSSISNCYATGTVNGDTYVGGLLGAIENSTITNCYSIGRVASEGGGLVANQVGSTITNSYWNFETSAQSTSAAGEPKSTFQLIYASTFTDWPFGSTWNIVDGGTYPYLAWQGSASVFNYPPAYIPPSNLTATPHEGYISLAWQAPSISGVSAYYIYRDGSYYTQTTSLSFDDWSVSNFTNYTYYITAVYSGYESSASNKVTTFPNPGFTAGGDGTASNPYLISNASELYTTRLYLSSHFKQINDIDIYPWNTGDGWIPIGTFDKPFTGSYDGNGFSINYLVIYRPAENAIGLFGSMNGAVIENINFFTATITGNSYVGVVAGDVNNSTLTNISVLGNVTGVDFVGGISGGNFQYSTINKSHSTGTINATGNQIGGITGVNYGTSLINSSYSTMNIYATGNAIGGISGTNEFTSTISNSYSLGAVYGNVYVGGIVGWIDTSFVNNCYSIAYISGTSSVGGIVGASFNEGKVNSSYWNTETTGQSTSAGGESRTTSEMSYPYSNTYLDWDFTYIWANDDTFSINNGYPYLRMLEATAPIVTTYAPDSYTSNSAIVRGNVTSDGGVTVTARGMVWSTSSNPTIESNNGMTLDGQGLGVFTSTLSNLSPSKKYYVKAYATNNLGTSYGSEVNFTTLSGEGSLTIFGNSVVCQGAKGESYSIGVGYTNISWNITNGTIASGAGTNNIKVNWNNTGSNGIVAVQAVNNSSVTLNGSLNINFSGGSSLPKPAIYVKGAGATNILICTTAGAASYQWYKNDLAISSPEGQGQYYVARTNTGSYYVGIGDNSGCLSFSDPKNVTNNKSLNLYPNPATHSTTLSFEAEETGLTTVRIINMFGITVKQMEWDKPDFQLQQEIPLDDLNKGVYMIDIAVEGVSSDNQRFIIN